jgi:hypothetical protein
MSLYKNVILIGVAHWSVRGKIEDPKWTWWIEADGLSQQDHCGQMLQKQAGLSFIQELKPYLPSIFQQEELAGESKFIAAPVSIPGGTWNIRFPLEGCSERENVDQIIMKHFPPRPTLEITG